MKANKGTFLCLPYDINDIYAFWCARYTNISYEDFMKIKKSEFNRKIGSIPKNEPLYEIIQSRVINLGKIKNKEERKLQLHKLLYKIVIVLGLAIIIALSVIIIVFAFRKS